MHKNTVIETWMTARDGVKLYTLLQLPEPEGRFPVIIRRNPYARAETDLEALKNEAVNIIIVHNHPSGSVRPSKNDIEGTKRIKMAGDLLGIALLDHIIIGDRKYTSFQESGLINQ